MKLKSDIDQALIKFNAKENHKHEPEMEVDFKNFP